MPSTRPTVDPVLDILEELGYDFDELDGDEVSFIRPVH